MSLLLPFLALGGLYIISNQEKEDLCENFTGYGKANNALPGVNPPPLVQNYPIDKGVSNNNVKRYSEANQTTDKFFDPNVSDRIEITNPPGSAGSGRDCVTGLDGKPINRGNFKFNNMVPFFGAKIKGATCNADIAQTVLDNMQGAGSQMIRKEERAPLFKPENNLQFANGAPNVSDFMQSRVNPSSRMANIKPWAEQKIAPGLNKGFNGSTSAGFNSGMESRDSWLPKTVNQLRVDTNPKMTFGLQGHEGPANAFIKEGATKQAQGKVEKYLPDTYYTVGPDRWFTTTGLEKKQTARGEEVLHHVNRTTTSCPYFGAGNAENDGTYTTGAHEAPKRPVLDCTDIINLSATGSHNPHPQDHGAGSYNNLPNNRSTTKQTTPFGIVQGVMKAITAPVLDILRPSRKEDVIGNLRPTGNAGSAVESGHMFNPADRTRTTIREMTGDKMDGKYLNINSQADIGKGGYLVSKQSATYGQRDTTNCSYNGSAGPATSVGNPVYNAAYNQRNNPNKTYKNRPNQGGTQIFNQHDNISIHKKDTDRNNNRLMVPDCTTGAIPCLDTYGKVNAPQYYNECKSCERIEPNILSAFKKNPYAQSLQSWA